MLLKIIGYSLAYLLLSLIVGIALGRWLRKGRERNEDKDSH
ncbi:hypothetical protein [Methylomagnum sp.]